MDLTRRRKPPKSRAEGAATIHKESTTEASVSFLPREAWKRMTQKTETKFQGFLRKARNAAPPRKKPWKARLHLLPQITPWHFFALKKGKKMVVGDGFKKRLRFLVGKPSNAAF